MQSREQRKLREFVDLSKYSTPVLQPEPEPEPTVVESESEPEPEPEPEPVLRDFEIVNTDESLVEPVTIPAKKENNMVNIFYKDGQNLDKCLIANRYFDATCDVSCSYYFLLANNNHFHFLVVFGGCVVYVI